MGAAKPTTVGETRYPSRTAAVLGLRGKGWSTRMIAAAIGIADATVAALEHSAARGRPQERKTRPAETLGRTVLFPADVLDGLKPAAQARGITANELARRIVVAVHDDGLVDAVLDDQEPGQEAWSA